MANWQKEVCVLIIDVQEDFYAVVKDTFPKFAENTTSLLAKCRENGILVIHVRAEYNVNVSDWMNFWTILNEASGRGIVGDVYPNTPTDFAKELPGEPVIIKNTFNAFLDTPLHSLLQERGIKHVLCAGVVTSCCVLFSMSGAFFNGYKVSMITDCCADRTIEKQENTINIYGSYMFAKTNLENFIKHSEEFHNNPNRLPSL